MVRARTAAFAAAPVAAGWRRGRRNETALTVPFTGATSLLVADPAVDLDAAGDVDGPPAGALLEGLDRTPVAALVRDRVVVPVDQHPVRMTDIGEDADLSPRGEVAGEAVRRRDRRAGRDE